MRLTGKTLIGALVLCAAGVAGADTLAWAARGTAATLVPGGVVGPQALNVCRATVGSVVAVGELAGDGSGGCRVVVGSAQQAAPEFEVLAQVANGDVSFTWVPGHATSYPLFSVIGGQAADGRRTVVCAAVHRADGTVHPGFIADENCVYGANGSAFTSENYLVLVTDDPQVQATDEAQPSLEGFDPNAILGIGAVASLCGLAESLCVPRTPR